uniref:Pept_C1 domain-containing protein n=1 Tax=Steinernema glaseri TaxID=37863 RepID=A0A1I7YUG8_9BILA
MASFPVIWCFDGSRMVPLKKRNEEVIKALLLINAEMRIEAVQNDPLENEWSCVVMRERQDCSSCYRTPADVRQKAFGKSYAAGEEDVLMGRIYLALILDLLNGTTHSVLLREWGLREA